MTQKLVYVGIVATIIIIGYVVLNRLDPDTLALLVITLTIFGVLALIIFLMYKEYQRGL